MNLVNNHRGDEKKKGVFDSLWSLLFSLMAFMLVAAQLDCAQDLAGTSAGPGLTVDEPFNVSQGRVSRAGQSRSMAWVSSLPKACEKSLNIPTISPIILLWVDC